MPRLLLVVLVVFSIVDMGCNRKTAAFLRGARPVRIGKNQPAEDSSAYGKAVVAFSNE